MEYGNEGEVALGMVQEAHWIHTEDCTCELVVWEIKLIKISCRSFLSSLYSSMMPVATRTMLQ
jgi:hypothetical protein